MLAKLVHFIGSQVYHTKSYIPQADKFDITDYTSYKYAYHIKEGKK